MAMRESMIIYRSFFEAIKELPKEEQADVWNAVYELGLNNKEVQLTGISKTIFTLIKPQIEANVKIFLNICFYLWFNKCKNSLTNTS